MAKKLKQLLVLVLVVALTAALAIGGTVAYLTDRDSAANVFTVGDVSIDLTEDFEQGATLTPGKDITKKAEVINTGKNDAWVWVDIAVPATLADNQALELVLPVMEDTSWTWAQNGTVTIDTIEYNVYTVKYQTALKPGETTATPALTKVSLDKTVDIDPEGNWYIVVAGKVTDLKWNTETNGAPTIYVSAYAIQAETFESVEEAYAAYNTQWADKGTEWAGVTEYSVADDAGLKDALTKNVEGTLVVDLTEDVTYVINARGYDPMGGDKTETIIINGNGNTITFNQTNADGSDINTNGAKLIINNAKITNVGHNDGPWNRHDLNFACDVELNNVTSDKAMAFMADATLKNVVINDANIDDTYAIWIQPNGQTVTLDGVTIDMLNCTDGRGIKIDEQYVDAPKKVTLKVFNTTFKTEEKSAILVKSAAGADIILGDDVDISGVKADATNAVWVDSDSAAYADLVTVNGGRKIVEQ